MRSLTTFPCHSPHSITTFPCPTPSHSIILSHSTPLYFLLWVLFFLPSVYGRPMLFSAVRCFKLILDVFELVSGNETPQARRKLSCSPADSHILSLTVCCLFCVLGHLCSPVRLGALGRRILYVNNSRCWSSMIY